jgi:hypothetical protein
MAAGSTYTPIATTTLGSATGSYTFSSIPATYTDLVLIADWSNAAGTGTAIILNGDTSGNYSYTYMYGTGSAAGSGRNSNATNTGIGYDPTANRRQNSIVHFMNYSNTTTYKTILVRNNVPEFQIVGSVNLWRSTAAINSIKIDNSPQNFNAGATFTLYGISAA